jgi:uncharacterized protein
MGSGTAWRPGPVGAFCAIGGSGVVSGYQPDLAHPGSSDVLGAEPSRTAGDTRDTHGGVPGRSDLVDAAQGGVLDPARCRFGGRPQPGSAPASSPHDVAGWRGDAGVRGLAPHCPTRDRRGGLRRPGATSCRGGRRRQRDGFEGLNMAQTQGFGATGPVRPSVAARVALRLVHWYQSATANRPSPCRYVPTCSSYALDAFELHGFLKGSWLTLRRIGRCHPWGRHGWDPVPDHDGRRAPEPGGAPPTDTPDEPPHRRPA